MRNGLDTYRIPLDLDLAQPEGKDYLNRVLNEIHLRLGTVQSIGAKKPKAPQNLAATGKQGVIWWTWQRVEGVDGYIIVLASESTMTKIVGRETKPDSESCSYQLSVGNVASTFYAQVYSYRGNQVSDPSPTASGTSIAYGAGESAPPTPPQDPRNPKFAGVTGGPVRP